MKNKNDTLIIVTAIALAIVGIVFNVVVLSPSARHLGEVSSKGFSAAELAGYNVYKKEGCITCHTQFVRDISTDEMRYGTATDTAEFRGKRTQLFGSRRIGADLARVGRKYPYEWLYERLSNPSAVAKNAFGSNMPNYRWLADEMVDIGSMQTQMHVLHIPYTDADIERLRNMTELEALSLYLAGLGDDAPAMDIDVNMSKLHISDADATNGEQIYLQSCASCHGERGIGAISKSLNHLRKGLKDEDIYNIIAKGIDGVMPWYAYSLTPEEIQDTMCYIRSVQVK